MRGGEWRNELQMEPIMTEEKEDKEHWFIHRLAD